MNQIWFKVRRVTWVAELARVAVVVVPSVQPVEHLVNVKQVLKRSTSIDRYTNTEINCIL
jgi:hypothetical protein